jgi:hypothetical protein
MCLAFACFATDEALVIGVSAHVLSVSVQGMGSVTASLACPFGCTYSGPVCPRNCAGDPRSKNASIQQPLGGISCIENAPFGDADWGICSLPFPAQDTVTLTPIPARDEIFTGWGGDCAGSGACRLPMLAEHSVSAAFAAARKALAPSITHVSQTHASWRRRRVRNDRAAKGPSVGTAFSFRLNESASVKLSFARQVAGHLLGGACVVRGTGRRGRAGCIRFVAAGAMTLTGHAGGNVVRFDGLLPGHRELGPGRYRLKIVATAPGGHSRPALLRFSIELA